MIRKRRAFWEHTYGKLLYMPRIFQKSLFNSEMISLEKLKKKIHSYMCYYICENNKSISLASLNIQTFEMRTWVVTD